MSFPIDDIEPGSKSHWHGRPDPWNLIISSFDAATVKDPALAKLGRELCEQLHDWMMDGRKPEAARASWFDDTRRLLESRLRMAAYTGAHCVRFLKLALPSDGEWLLTTFDASPAQSRCFMLKASIARRPSLARPDFEILRRGLSDRSRHVRLYAAEACQMTRSRSLLPVLQEAMLRETVPSNLESFQRARAILEQGYWLSPTPDAFGLRALAFPLVNEHDEGIGTSSTSIAELAFGELPEAEIVCRVMASIDPKNPAYGEAAKWFHATHAAWRKSRGFNPAPDSA